MKKINLVFEGRDYTLEFTRESVKRMEQAGFYVTDIEKKPMTNLPELFKWAFWANHRKVKKGTINQIFDNITDKEDLIGKLAEMYAEPITELMEDPDEPEKNVSWTATW